MIRGWDWWLPASLSRLSHETSGVRHQIHSPQSSQMGSTQSSCKKTGFPTKRIWPSSQIPPFLGRRTIMVVTRLVETGPRPNNTTTVDFEANAFRPIKKGLNHPKTSLLAIKCPNLAPPTHPQKHNVTVLYKSCTILIQPKNYLNVYVFIILGHESWILPMQRMWRQHHEMAWLLRLARKSKKLVWTYPS